MLKGGIFIFIIVTGTVCLKAQELSHQVLVPVASTWQGGNYSLSQTVGEPVVAFVSGGNRDLTQGFQQPSMMLNPIVPPQGNGVDVYPNPVSDLLKIEMFGDVSVDYSITVFGIDGSVYFRQDYPCSGRFWRIETLDVSGFKRGIYFVRVETFPRKIGRMFKIEKM